jgi:hypothetical protein
MIAPLSLTDAELDIVMTAARQLQRHQRDGFLRRIAEVLAAMPDRRGEGAVYRAVAALQRAYFHPPSDRVTGHNSPRRDSKLTSAPAIGRPDGRSERRLKLAR